MHATFQNFIVPVGYNNTVQTLPPSPLNKVKEKPLETKQKVAAYIGSSAMTIAMARVSKNLFNIFVNKPLYRVFINSCQFTPQENKIFEQGAQKILESEGLRAKGIELKYLAESAANRDELRNKLISVKKLPLNLQKIPFVKKRLLKKAKAAYQSYINGTNACFMRSKEQKVIWINEKKIMNVAFHELGHAKSSLKPAFLLDLISIKYGKYVPYLFGAAILLPKHKKEKLNASEKFDNAVINSLPYVVLAGNVPTLVEEAKASIYGKEFAKKVLQPALYKKVVTSYKKAYLTYIGGALSCAAIYKLMVITKDESDRELRNFFANKNQTFDKDYKI